MKIGEIYRNESAGDSNPHKIGIYIGRANRGDKKYPQFLHLDGRKSCFAGPKENLTLLGVAFTLDQILPWKTW